jgi:signal transduction histidine kinase
MYPSAGDVAGSSPDRARRRQRLVDLVLVAGAVAFGALILISTVDGRSSASLVFDVAVGSFACGSLFVRRSFVVQVAVLAVVASAISAAAAGASLVALFTAAIRVRPWVTAVLTGAELVATFLFPLVYPGAGGFGYPTQVLIGSLINFGVVGWGLMVGAQRNHLRAVLERANDLETRQQLETANARDQERRRIAREMHDVLAHRLSLLSVQAGALEFRSDMSPDQAREIAGVIRQTSHRALNELHDVIGVLRDGSDGAGLLTPGVGLDDLAALIDESRLGGADVHFEPPADAVGPEESTAPENRAVGATVYRIVQEGLTNARKHAPGSAVLVAVHLQPPEITVSVSTFLGAGLAERPAIPGAGAGLRGLRERVSLVGGRFSAEVVANQFVIVGRLPWAP